MCLWRGGAKWERPDLSAELRRRHVLDRSDGFSCQLLQVLIGALALHLSPVFGGHNRVQAVSRSGAPTGLHLGNLICKQSVAHHQVAFWDVEAFFGHAGGDEEVEMPLAKAADGFFLLGLDERKES